ncbi:hypothetical protein SBOR_7606 [Sclerotinia borealis F-4128]|uniref:Uncharacterized protein n=1 Tax=Sclerotinia borealis (strain F-4128) TaxID=1432307 RepID=W9C887_SCLBF|nr:hypothetical protein SBOR_7606 [Sclerotinia borealis F-4128]
MERTGFSIFGRAGPPPTRYKSPPRPTLAEEFAEIDEELEDFSEFVSPASARSQREASVQIDAAIARQEKYLRDHNTINEAAKKMENIPPPISMAQRRFPQPQTPLKSATKSVPKSVPKSPLFVQTEASLKSPPLAQAEAALKSPPLRFPQTEASLRSPRSAQAEAELKSPRFPRTEASINSPRLSQSASTTPTPAQRVSRPLSHHSQDGQASVRETQVSPRRTPAVEQEFIVTPPPLPDGVFDIIKREYGWSWILWLLIPTLLVAFGVYASYGLYERQLVTEASKTGAAKTNANAVVEISSAINDIAKIVLDGEGTLRRLEDSPFNRAALPIEQLRKDVLEGEGKGHQPLFWVIDKFIAKSREVDHDWRSFIQQQAEVTAELAGIFDGYARNAGSDGHRTNWMGAAKNITLEDYSDIPRKVEIEGERLLCNILGKAKGLNCSPAGLKLIEAYDDLKKSLNKPNIKIPPKTFDAYSATMSDIAKVIKSILKRWEKALAKIEAAQVKFKQEFDIGSAERVTQELDTTAKTLTEAMSSSFIFRIASPKFPAAISRLAESKVWTKGL